MTERSRFLEHRLAGEQRTFARPLRALVTRPPVVCGENETIRNAVALMRNEGVGSVIVVDAAARPIGIFTTTNLIGVAGRGIDDDPVASAMTHSPLSLPAHTLAYEAALAMISNRIRHVVVTEEARAIGVVSERDLFSLQRLGLGEITTEIRLAQRVEMLADIAAEIRKLARLLVDEGVAPEQLTLFVSVLNDRLSQRVIELERKRHQWDGISWCWLAFGSEGRFEQTFSTDQDNGLIFVSFAGLAPGAVREQLLPFARAVNEALDACGFPLCKGNVMASNPKLCLSRDEWRDKLTDWLDTPDPKALLDAAICLDFRPLAGDPTLAVALREWMLGRTRANPAFLRQMAENAMEARPALGTLRDFATEDAPGMPRTINLKLHGVRPFVDCARIYALASGEPHTNTAERLRATRAASGMSPIETEAIVESFFVIQRLRLRNQAALADLTDPAANRIDPEKLHALDRATLKEAFRHGKNLQSRLAMDYRL